jgi:hypothetical protein
LAQLCSQCGSVGLAGTDADSAIGRRDEDLAITDLSGLGGARDGAHHNFDLALLDGDFNSDFGQEIHGVIMALMLLVAFLASKAHNLGNGHAFDASAREYLTDVIKLERFDDGNDPFHRVTLEIQSILPLKLLFYDAKLSIRP